MTEHVGDGRDRSAANTGVHNLAILEETLRSAVSERVGATRFALWFGGNVRLGLNREGDSFEVCVPVGPITESLPVLIIWKRPFA
jgi:hypothetical protein